MMDTIDKIIEKMASKDINMTREQVNKRTQVTGDSPEKWLEQMGEFERDIKDLDYDKPDPTGVFDMRKFSDPIGWSIE